MADSVNKLVAALEANPRMEANNVVKLLQLLPKFHDDGLLKTAIRGLKQFFVFVYQEDVSKNLNSKRQKTSEGPASHVKAAEDAFTAWVTKRHADYVNHLLALIDRESCSVSIQVTVVVALMESVRSVDGLGRFSPDLYYRVLAVILTSGHIRSEVFTLLATKYFNFADVRYYTLTSIKRLADAVSLADSPSRALVSLAAIKQLSAAKGADSSSNSSSPSSTVNASAPPARRVFTLMACNTYDLLSKFEPVATALPATDADPSEWSSWSGGAEAGLVVAGGGVNESSKDRRKRNRAEAEARGGDGLNGSTAAAAAAAASSSMAAAQPTKATWLNVKNQKRAFGDAWLACLRLPLPFAVLRRALLLLPTRVIPHLLQPLQLSDLLTFLLNRGGLVGILALHGLFQLVTKHGLEYPAFYARLYQLITADAFAAKHRSQFFKLVDIFLASPLVPAYTIAAFLKKFARLALTAPPAGATLAVAFVHNLIRRHPSLFIMLNKTVRSADGNGKDKGGEGADGDDGDNDEGSKSGNSGSNNGNNGNNGRSSIGKDVYDFLEPDPAKSRAVESSLWELEALRNHYCPQVAALLTCLDKDLTDRTKTHEVDISELLQGSYSALFNQEVERRLKAAPVAFYTHPPMKLFDDASFSVKQAVDGGALMGDFAGWA